MIFVMRFGGKKIRVYGACHSSVCVCINMCFCLRDGRGKGLGYPDLG